MNWNSNDTKYIIKKVVIYLLIAFAMFIISTWKVNALEYNQGNLIGNLVRINTINGNIDGSFDSNSIATINSSNPYRQQTMGIYFRTTTYFGYQNKKYRFTGHIQTSGDTKLNIEGIWFADGTGTAIGKCDYNSTGIDNKIAFTLDCDIPSGLVNQNYGNILQFAISSEYSNNFSISIYLSDKFLMYDKENDTSQIQQGVQDINNSINNDSVTTSDADNFTNNQAFTDTTGLESVIQLPLNMVNSLTNTCQPIQITIPFINYTGVIPCMSTIYQSKFNTLYTIVKIVVNGFFVYRLLLKIYELVHNAKQPDEDKLEVIDL